MPKAKRASTKEPNLNILPANQASWEDLETILGSARCHGGSCYCQRFKLPGSTWPNLVSDEQRADRLRAQTQCDHPKARTTSGLVAYLGDEPVGWCNVEPRPEFAWMPKKMPWAGRNEDPDDPSVWVVSCFIVRNGYRKRGFTYALARAAVDFARQRGARALEGYAMITEPGKTITWGELHVGALQVFAAAGFKEVTHPSKRRFVMRVDF
jgi:GNAT superfamily N-acetyltransferase